MYLLFTKILKCLKRNDYIIIRINGVTTINFINCVCSETRCCVAGKVSTTAGGVISMDTPLSHIYVYCIYSSWGYIMALLLLLFSFVEQSIRPWKIKSIHGWVVFHRSDTRSNIISYCSRYISYYSVYNFHFFDTL